MWRLRTGLTTAGDINLPKIDDDDAISNIVNVMTWQRGGNVGIGTTSPLAKLDVNGTASVSGALSLYGTPTIASTAMQTLNLGGTTTGNIQLSPGSATPTVVVTTGGQVGIGTTARGAPDVTARLFQEPEGYRSKVLRPHSNGLGIWRAEMRFRPYLLGMTAGAHRGLPRTTQT